MKTGFFAYAASQRYSCECIEDAIEQINASGEIKLISWKSITNNGNFIPNAIIDTIDNADFFCADLTGLNDNVLFELGYAIAKKKPIFLIFDTTHRHSIRRFKEFNLLTTIAYSSYTKTPDIVTAFYLNKPYDNLNKDYDKIISPYEGQAETDKAALLWLNSQVETNYSQLVLNEIQTLKLPVIIDDPSEAKIQPISWYIKNLTSVPAIITQFSATTRTGFELQNSKCAFISGIALGLDLKVLMIAEEPYEVPLDFRNLVKNYNNKESCLEAIQPFLLNLHKEIAELLTRKRKHTLQQKKKNNLQKINFGECIAEHESDNIFDYFVDLPFQNSLLKRDYNIVIGRKGSGKTASLYFIEKTMETDKRNLVCAIKPINFELDGLLILIEKFNDEFAKGYFIEAIWKFLIYTEIAKSLYEKLKTKPLYSISSDEASFIDYIEERKQIFLTDFSTRLEEQLEQAMKELGKMTDDQRSFKQTISEVFHDGIIKELKNFLGNIIPKDNKVVVLIDNLDKNWKKNSKLEILSKFILGLLGTSGRIATEFSHIGSRKNISFHLTIFLRSDIFKYIMDFAREPDKIDYSRLKWEDPETLFRIIEERFIKLNESEASEEDLWKTYVTPTVEGVDVKKYISDRIFPRPRDIIYFFKSAKDFAVGRGHEKIKDVDIISAYKNDYSNWVFKSILVENGVTINQMQDFMYHLMASPQIINKEIIAEHMKTASIYSESDEKTEYFIDYLVSLSIIGREIKENNFEFEYDFDGVEKLKILSQKYGSKRYKIHNALAPYLECS